MTPKTPMQNRHKTILEKAWLPFLISLIAVFGINLLAIQIKSDCGLPALMGIDACSDDIVRVGWPLSFYEKGGIASHTLFSTSALEFDVLVGVVGAILLTLLILRLRRTS